jgi:predicted dehydrogenase
VTARVRVGVAGLGFMGQTHVSCYRRCAGAELVAVSDRNAGKSRGEAVVKGNIETGGELDLRGVRTTQRVEELIAASDIDVIDLCLPTPQHATLAIAALNAGKHVFCEKPMALRLEECDAMIEAARANGKFLFVGHCLRFWPQYVAAAEIIRRGDLGRIRYARFHRAGGAPLWSRWLCDGEQSGGVVLDMHIHDVDTALWWFGEPASVEAHGVIEAGLPLQVDAKWRYEGGGPLVQLHGGWDPNRSDFVMGFEVMGEKASLSWNSGDAEPLKYHQAGKIDKLEVEEISAYQSEINYLIDCIASGTKPERVTPESSRLAVQIAREEWRQMKVELELAFETGHQPVGA